MKSKKQKPFKCAECFDTKLNFMGKPCPHCKPPNFDLMALRLAAKHIKIGIDVYGCKFCPCEEQNVRYCWGKSCEKEIVKHLRRRAVDAYYNKMVKRGKI